MQTVLDKVTSKDVRRDPFPHIVIENAIDESLALKLSSQYPPLEVLMDSKNIESNKRFNLSCEKLKFRGLSEMWQSFLRAHSSKDFFQKFVSVFRDDLIELHSSFLPWWENPQSVRVGTTGTDSFKEHDVLMSAYMSGNTPVSTEKATSVKIAHIDNLYKLFSGLFYLRSPEDDSKGGELELYRFKGPSVKFHGQRFIDQRYVEVATTIPYRLNTLVLFPFSIRSAHGVTVREKTPHLRKFMNLSCDVKNDLIDLSPYWENVFDKVRRRVRTDVFGIDVRA